MCSFWLAIIAVVGAAVAGGGSVGGIVVLWYLFLLKMAADWGKKNESNV